MTIFEEERRRLADQIWDGLASPNELNVGQVRSFVRGLQTSWGVQPSAWTEADSGTQLRDARRLLHAARLYRELDGVDSLRAADCFRRAGEMLEWLSRADDILRTHVPLELLAAAAFQLGGFPAMSRALLTLVPQQHDGLKLYSAFLQADFDEVLRLAAAFWRSNPELTGRGGSTELLRSDVEDSVDWYYTVEMVRTLGLFSDSLRRGDQARLQQAQRKFLALGSMAARTYGEDAWLLVELLHQVSEEFEASSIYRPITRLGEQNPERITQLLRYARGQFSRGRGILWRPQLDALARLEGNSSLALCTPTGSGKTLVAVMALIKELIIPEQDGLSPLALYLVPSRALAGEVEARLTSELGGNLKVTGLYGGTDWGMTDYWLGADEPTVLVATVEKADALMRYVGPMMSARLKLLIVDEAHQVVPGDREGAQADLAAHRSRPARLESFVTRLLANSPDVARVALTAVAGGAAVPVARWIQGDIDASPVGSSYRSTRQLVGAIEFAPGRPARAVIEMLNGRRLFVRGRGDSAFIPLRFTVMPQLPSAMRNSINRFNACNVLWTSLHLAQEGRRVLISIMQEPEEMMSWFRQALELESWAPQNLFAMSQVPAHQVLFDEAVASCIDYCGEESNEVALLRYGIATNHGQMPQRLRRLMVSLVERQVCPIAVATATLTEGVNLPFDIIFLTSVKRSTYRDEESIVNPISVPEFLNLAGRAGRPGSSKSIEGMVLVALPDAISTTAPRQVRVQSRQLQSLRDEFNDLLSRILAQTNQEEILSPLALLLESIRDLASEVFELSGEAFLEWLERTAPSDITDQVGEQNLSPESTLADSLDELDGILLCAVEEVRNLRQRELSASEVEELLRRIWQHSFARVAAQQEQWLEQVVLRRGAAITESIYPDAEERARLYRYGYSPQVGRRFDTVVPQLLNVIREAEEYGVLGESERLGVFVSLIELVKDDPGFGFQFGSSIVDQFLRVNWSDALAWWMNVSSASGPEPLNLRKWQRFVADNLEFRLGTAIGAAIAGAWNEGADDPTEIPSLAQWKATTKLPWIGFWTRELLRWGTLDPFEAFVMSQGLAGTRAAAGEMRPRFDSWASENGLDDPEGLIDPQNFQSWRKTESNEDRATPRLAPLTCELTGTDGRRGRYAVVPVGDDENNIRWLDPAGHELGRSEPDPRRRLTARTHTNDFQLVTEGAEGRPAIIRTFQGVR
jgi:hypothetical protein